MKARKVARTLAQLIRNWGSGINVLFISGVALMAIVLALQTVDLQSPEQTRYEAQRTGHDAALAAKGEPSAVTPRNSLEDAPGSAAWLPAGAARVDRGFNASPQAVGGAEDFDSTDAVSVRMTATTESGGGSVVFNGDRITYTITITNDTTLNGVLIRDGLPEDTLEDILCDGCIKQFETITVPEPLGGVVVVTVTTEVIWEITPTLAPGVTQRMVSGRVTGQSDGTLFRNQAFVLYNQDQTIASNEIETTARVRVEILGEASVSSAPTWFSNDVGGTLSVDWGDFDGDGDLDLAQGTSLGATIYQNSGGTLTALQGDHDDSSRQAYGVRWADLDNDDRLELVVVGDSVDDTAATQGINYVYRWDGVDRFEETNVFTSVFQLVRLAPGDYDGDSYVDLVVSTNGINPACPVQLYTNTLKMGSSFFANPGQCVSERATASIGPGDFDNDGDLDLALGLFPETVKLFENKSNGITTTNPFTDPLLIDASLSFLPYDFAWADYDGDGYMDLAAAFPLERRIRIYTNPAGGIFDRNDAWSFREIRSESFMTPLFIDWGDFDGDGRLDLAAAGSPPRVYRYDAIAQTFSQITALSPDPLRGQIWSMPAADFDNDGDLDLSLSNRDGPSVLFTTFAPFLNPKLDGIGSWGASSVAWGDGNKDGYLDLLFGAGTGQVNSRLYLNDKKGSFPDATKKSYTSSGFGPQGVAFGDIDGDYDLDLAFGGVGTNKVYRIESSAAYWASSLALSTRSLAWADADDDEDLDLLVGNNGQNCLYINENGQLANLPAWSSGESNTRAVAWGDYNQDRYLDFAVGNYQEANQVFINNGDNTFSLAWTSTFVSRTTSIAWGDWDGDGDPDLAVGNQGEANVIYGNLGGALSQEPVWKSPEASQTTSLAWGDWDNDGDLDLAVGNYGEHDQVYANLSTPSAPQLVWLWTSQEVHQTTGIAWGDRDRDGDLDLAISQGGSGTNGTYENTYVTPSHLTNDFDDTMPLPNNPSYVWVERPGNTNDAYFYSAAEILHGLIDGAVEIEYRLMDPDPAGTRNEALKGPDQEGDSILTTIYEYSLDGGGTWKEATPSGTMTSTVLTTTRRGNWATFLWDITADEAIADNARFRVTVVQQNRNTPFQRAAISAISPPFRVRGLECFWPEDPSISYAPSEPQVNEAVTFQGGLGAGSGVLTFTWDFGDGSPVAHGQVVQHAFIKPGTFDVRLTITSEPCPVAKAVFTSKSIVIKGSAIHLPIVWRSVTPQTTSGADASHPLLELAPMPEIRLWGVAQPEDRATFLEWQAINQGERELTGYRIYRRNSADSSTFQLLATVPADVNSYIDRTASCGQSYYVMALDSTLELVPSTTSFFNPPCSK